MQNHLVGLLNGRAAYTVHHDGMIAQWQKFSTVLAQQADDRTAVTAHGLTGANKIFAVAAGGKYDQRISGLGQCFNLPGENGGEIPVVGDAGKGRGVRGQGNRG